MTTPRPDQRRTGQPSAAPGSRSGSGDLAAALGYPGQPPAVPNLLSFTLQRQGAGTYTIGTFPAAGRLWLASLQFCVTTGSNYSGVTQLYAEVTTVLSGLPLAFVESAAAGPSQVVPGRDGGPLPGVPVVTGESIQVIVNGGFILPQGYMRASAIVLYSIP